MKKGIRHTRYETKKRLSQFLCDLMKNWAIMTREAVTKFTSE
jgi:hypothetical protein